MGNSLCLLELSATYLDKITSPMVRGLPSYVKDTNHMLDIVQSFRYPPPLVLIALFSRWTSSHCNSHCNNDGLVALQHF